MSIHTALTLWAVTLVYIFAKAFQQINVQGDHYWWVPPVSYMMGLCEVTVMLWIVRENTIWAFVPMGTGGWMGSWLAMYLHKRFVRRRK